MDFNDEYCVWYLEEEYRIFGSNPDISNDFVDAYNMGTEI